MHEPTNGDNYRSEKFKLPIYTLLVWTGRIYVVNDAHLASAIQRRTDAFTFDPFVVMAAERLVGTTTEGMKLVRQDIVGSHLKRGLVTDIRDKIHRFLNSSSCLESMSREMFGNVAVALQGLEHSDGTVINLSSWIKHAITIASTTTFYGPFNPFITDSEVYPAFW